MQNSHADFSSLRYHNNTILEGQYRGLLATTNCTDLICLRSLDTETLKVAQQQTFVNAYYTVPNGLYGYGDFYYGPSVRSKAQVASVYLYES